MNDPTPIPMDAPAVASNLGSPRDAQRAHDLACTMAMLLEALVRPGQPDGMPIHDAAFVVMKALDQLLRGAGLEAAEARRAMCRDLDGAFDDAPEPPEPDAADDLAAQPPPKVWGEDDPGADVDRTLLQVRSAAAANAALLQIALRAGEADGMALIDATHLAYLTGAILLEFTGVSRETRAELLEHARDFYAGVQPFVVRPEMDPDTDDAASIDD